VDSKALAVKVVSSGFGLGYLPVAPGTWASAAAATLYWMFRCCPGAPGLLPVASLCMISAVTGIVIGREAEEAYGRRDPGHFVLDEMAGCWLTCLLFWWRTPLATAVAAFVAFRVFDIAKPFPIRRLEKLPHGWGVMSDDLVAGLYAAATLWVVCYAVIDPLIT